MILLNGMLSWGKLRIFWAKPVKDIHVIDEEGEAVLMDVKWIVRNRIRRAVLAIAEKGDVSGVIEKLCRYDATRILILPEDLAMDLINPWATYTLRARGSVIGNIPAKSTQSYI